MRAPLPNSRVLANTTISTSSSSSWPAACSFTRMGAAPKTSFTMIWKYLPKPRLAERSNWWATRASKPMPAVPRKGRSFR